MVTIKLSVLFENFLFKSSKTDLVTTANSMNQGQALLYHRDNPFSKSVLKTTTSFGAIDD